MSGLKFNTHVCALTLGLSLAACGGGGGGADTGASTGADPSQAQGIWQGTGSSGLVATTAALSDGTVWVVLSQGDQPVSLVQGSLASSGVNLAGTGSRYVFSPASRTPVSLNADARAQLSLSLRYVSPTASDTLQMSYQTRYESTLSIADVAGQWRGLTGDQVVAIDWTVTSGGIIEGRSSTGCTYSGVVSTRPEARAVLNARLTETCTDAFTSFDGVVTLSTDRLRANFAFMSADASSALLMGLRRQ